jgi:hypothetical protein
MDEDNHLSPGLPAAAAETGAVSGAAAGVNDRYQFIGITGRANRLSVAHYTRPDPNGSHWRLTTRH